jgi:hypothetical protein
MPQQLNVNSAAEICKISKISKIFHRSKQKFKSTVFSYKYAKKLKSISDHTEYTDLIL